MPGRRFSRPTRTAIEPPRCPGPCGETAAGQSTLRSSFPCSYLEVTPTCPVHVAPRYVDRDSVLLEGVQPLREFRSFVVTVQGVATRRQSIPRRGCAIAEGSANPLMLNSQPSRRVPE